MQMAIQMDIEIIQTDSDADSSLGSHLSSLGSRLSALVSRLSALGSRLSALSSRLSDPNHNPNPNPNPLISRLLALGSPNLSVNKVSAVT